MNWVIVIAIWILWLVFSAFRASSRKQSKSSNAQTKQNEASDDPQIFHNPEDILKKLNPEYREEKNVPSSSGYTSELEMAAKSHYSEEALVKQFKERHAKGLPLQHHLHNLGELGIPNSTYDKETGFKKPHPIRKELRKKKNFQKALIIQEILKRKDY